MSCTPPVTSFPGLIPIDLTLPGEVMYPVASADCIWLPKVVVLNNKIFTNPLDAVVAIRVNTPTGDQLPWAIEDGYVNRISGNVTKLYATVMTQGTGIRLYLATGQNVSGSYASLDGLSPSFMGGKSGAGCIAVRTSPRGLPLLARVSASMKSLDLSYVYPGSGGRQAGAQSDGTLAVPNVWCNLESENSGYFYEDPEHWRLKHQLSSRQSAPDGNVGLGVGNPPFVDAMTKNPYLIGVTPGVSKYMYNPEGTVAK